MPNKKSATTPEITDETTSRNTWSVLGNIAAIITIVTLGGLVFVPQVEGKTKFSIAIVVICACSIFIIIVKGWCGKVTQWVVRKIEAYRIKLEIHRLGTRLKCFLKPRDWDPRFVRHLLTKWRADLSEAPEPPRTITFATPDQLESALVRNSTYIKLDEQLHKTIISELCTINCIWSGHFQLSDQSCCTLGVDVFTFFSNISQMPKLSEALYDSLAKEYGGKRIQKLVVLRREIPKTSRPEFLVELSSRFGKGCELLLISLMDLYRRGASVYTSDPVQDTSIFSCYDKPTLIIDPLPVGDGLLRKAAIFFRQTVRVDLQGICTLFSVTGLDPFPQVVCTGVQDLPNLVELLRIDIGVAESTLCNPGNPAPGHLNARPLILPLF